MTIGIVNMIVINWYLFICMMLGIGWLLYFGCSDLYSWYKNKRGNNCQYHFSDDLCQVVIITLSWSLPIVNIATMLLLIAAVTNSKKKG